MDNQRHYDQSQDQ